MQICSFPVGFHTHTIEFIHSLETCGDQVTPISTIPSSSLCSSFLEKLPERNL